MSSSSSFEAEHAPPRAESILFWDTGVYPAGIRLVDASQHAKLYDEMVARLRAARLEQGLTQTEVAKALGKPQSYVSKVESGERRLDPIELVLLARLYGKEVTDFLPRLDG